MCVHIFLEGGAEGKREARLQLDHKSSAQLKQKQCIMSTRIQNTRRLKIKLPEMGCQFQFSVEHHITKELLFKNKKGLRGRKQTEGSKLLSDPPSVPDKLQSHLPPPSPAPWGYDYQ